MQLFWYIPTTGKWADVRMAMELARSAEEYGWNGALIATGWGRADSMTMAAAIAATTTKFSPIAAVRPGYWQPAQFANAAATLHQLSGGRLLVNIVSGIDRELAAYGDSVHGQAERYAMTREFLQIVRRLWAEEDVTYQGEYFQVSGATLPLRPGEAAPRLYFGGASEAAQEVAAAEADMQIFWGEPLDAIAERIARLRNASIVLGRKHAPLEFGLHTTVLMRENSDEAWRSARERVAKMAPSHVDLGWSKAAGQERLIAQADRGDVLDSCLYTRPAMAGASASAASWLVGSPAEVAFALQKYADLGITSFLLSGTPYIREAARLGRELLPRLRSAVSS